LGTFIENFQSLRKGYGTFTALCLLTVYPEAVKVLGRIEKLILAPTNKDGEAIAKQMKESLDKDCSVVVVAVSSRREPSCTYVL